jgi:hypothetical protein
MALSHGIIAPDDRPQSRARIYLFPFDILCEDIAPNPRTFHSGPARYRVYWPFSNDGSAGTQLQQVRMENVPFPPGLRPHRPQDFQLHGLTGTHRQGDRIQPVANAIRIDRYPHNAPEIIARLIPLLRWLTWQWWIDRDRRHDESIIRNDFQIDSAGRMVGGIASLIQIAGRSRIEKPLSEKAYWIAVEQAISGRTAPLPALSLLDAIYSATVGDLRRSILDASIACELLLLDHGDRLLKRGLASSGDVRRAFQEGRLMLNLDRGLKDTIGRSFAEEMPADYAQIRKMWIARGKVAHGRQPFIVDEGGRRREMYLTDQSMCLRSVLRLIEWFQDLGYTLEAVAAPSEN